MNSASLCSLAGRYDNPIPTRFLAPTDCLKISALIGGGGVVPLFPPPPFYVHSRLLVRYLTTTLEFILLLGCFLHDNQYQPLVEYVVQLKGCALISYIGTAGPVCTSFQTLLAMSPGAGPPDLHCTKCMDIVQKVFFYMNELTFA
jgi:hypothetical protein